jgi:L-serine dehydratase
MRGPSSSHCAAAVRIGRMARHLMNKTIAHVRVECDHSGSLATTFVSQGSEMGLCGGLLGFRADDERLVSYKDHMQQAGIEMVFHIGDFGDPHPNTYRLTLKNSAGTHTLTALSTGGGMIEVIEMDGYPVHFKGDCFLTLVFLRSNPSGIIRLLDDQGTAHRLFESREKGSGIIEIKTITPLSLDLIAALAGQDNCLKVAQIPPALPILTPEHLIVPFHTVAHLTAYCRQHRTNLGQAALDYESMRGDTTKEYVLHQMISLVKIMRKAIEKGIAGTSYADRILPPQAGRFQSAIRSGSVLDAGLLNHVILNVTALMEAKSAMEVIVAAPTAGSCGALPGAIIGAGQLLHADDEQMAMALLAAGMIGVFIAKDATFAAEVGGCQAECGAGSGMAAAGLVTLFGGPADTAMSAASMALQNTFGMTCDPVANRVEVPCLGKNVISAANAVSCANMALAGFDPVIPLDEVITAMDRVGKSIPHGLRCTALGGLSVTSTSKKIEKRLLQQL